MVLVDTSVWIDVFRASTALDLEAIVDFDEIVTCLPVIQEVLQGFDDERAYRLARESILSLPIVESPLAEDVFLEAAELYRSARRRGITVRSGVDCLIATCALRNDLTVLHRDRDFEAIANVAPLRVRRLELPESAKQSDEADEPPMTTAQDDPIANLPPALESEFVMAYANEPIQLAAGRFDLVHQDQTLGRLEGELSVEWFPKLSIWCRGVTDAALPDLLNQSDLGIRVPQLDVLAEAFVSNVGWRKPHEVSAKNLSAENPRLRETRQFFFYLVNFPKYEGDLVRTGNGPRAGASRARQRISGRESLTCTIDQISHAGHSERRRGKPGYLLTHVAEIQRPDLPFSPAEVQDLLETLYWLFAFMRGARTGPVMPSLAAPFVEHWISIAPWTVDEPRQVESWLPERTRLDVDSLFTGFIEKWHDPVWRHGLKTTLAWYIAANAPSTPNEARLILCQIALEVLASLRGISKGHAPERIRNLLKDLIIPIDVPSRLEELAVFAGDEDAPQSLVKVRNWLKNPKSERSKSSRNMDGMVRYQAAQYCLELLELSVLSIFDYRGKYTRRAHQGRKGEQAVVVPWA